MFLSDIYCILYRQNCISCEKIKNCTIKQPFTETKRKARKINFFFSNKSLPNLGCQFIDKRITKGKQLVTIAVFIATCSNIGTLVYQIFPIYLVITSQL